MFLTKKSYLCSLYQLTNCETVMNFEVLPREICLAQDTSSLNGKTTTATLHMTSALDTSSTTTTPLANGTKLTLFLAHNQIWN